MSTKAFPRPNAAHAYIVQGDRAPPGPSFVDTFVNCSAVLRDVTVAALLCCPVEQLDAEQLHARHPVAVFWRITSVRVVFRYLAETRLEFCLVDHFVRFC